MNSAKDGDKESDDVEAYDLILKEKEKLLSFNNPVQFIFSHSALREGWDNPNVFQICTLRRGESSPVRNRQEVGRGLRLAVNQTGDRMDATKLGDRVQDVNLLTVIASETYGKFVSDLQTGIRENLRERPKTAAAGYFAGKVLEIDGETVEITKEQANVIHRYLIKNDYVDDNDYITDKYRADIEAGTPAPLPESCAGISTAVHALARGIFDEHALDGMIVNGHRTKPPENRLNENFYKKEFQTLWNAINHKYAYTAMFDGEELIKKAVAHINDKMYVSASKITVVTGRQESKISREELESGGGFDSSTSHTDKIKSSAAGATKYDLIGKIAAGTKLTRRTAAKILSSIRPDKFAMFKMNPEEFIPRIIRLIDEEKATMIVEHITYREIDGRYEAEEIFTAEKNGELSRTYEGKKSVQDYVFTDGYAAAGMSVERKFAEDLDRAEEVCVYAKLPKGFAIPTPVGSYSPDWAVAFYEGKVKHIYFIAETKGSMDSMQLRKVEDAKIGCAKKLFENLSSAHIIYDHVNSYEKLLDIMGNR